MWQPAFAPDARIARARELAREHAASAQLLSFYAELTGFQQTILHRHAPAAIRTGPEAQATVGEALDRAAVATLAPEFLSWLQRTAHQPLASAAERLLCEPLEIWRGEIERFWTTDGHEDPDADQTHVFVAEALLQPFAEAIASSRPPTQEQASGLLPADQGRAGARCPMCGGRPLVGILREHGHGRRRSLVCGLCLTEWPALRVVCPACNETRFDAISVYRADEFKGLRIDACDSCHAYIKTVDLAEAGSAVPIVDDLGSLPLDLWAGAQGYRKLRPNLLRL